MNTTRRGLSAAGMLAGAILLGTAGFAAAQDPTASPAASPAWSGSGIMNGQMGSGMTGGQMNGQMGSGMMTPELLQQMDAIHDQMVTSGGADGGQMDALHAQHHSTR